jgi:hypothetical protein
MIVGPAWAWKATLDAFAEAWGSLAPSRISTASSGDDARSRAAS